MSTARKYDICSIEEIKKIYKATIGYLQRFGYSETFKTFIEDLGFDEQQYIDATTSYEKEDMYLDDWKSKSFNQYFHHQLELVLCDYACLIKTGDTESVLKFIDEYLVGIKGLDTNFAFIELSFCLHFDNWHEIQNYITEKSNDNKQYAKLLDYFEPKTKLRLRKNYFYIKHHGNF
eukprot:GAHX01001869.1.p1 GENE.GAHX01001869.1~~GAHX01001869.1.p1  ORF type:complete len:176 (+),score=20.30 GAHX01001869.1:31-558(+)